MVALTDADRALVAQAVAKAEQMTSVELRLVLAHSSSHYGAFALIYPALLALIASGIAVAASAELDAETLFFGQAGLFLAAVVALQWLPLRFALIPPAVKRKAAWRHARLHYASIGLKQPHLRNAVLVFASSVEHSVEILVDDTVAEKLSSELWAPVIAEFRACFAEGRVAEAFVNAADSCALILARAFPPQPGQESQIPDELVEL
jgi:putative membrane protein